MTTIGIIGAGEAGSQIADAVLAEQLRHSVKPSASAHPGGGTPNSEKENDMTPRQAVFPEGRHALYEKHGYSAAIRSGDLLFVSGQVGSHSDGSSEPDLETQIRLAFANLEATLRAGGCTFDDIVDVTTFHTDPENQLETIMAVKSEMFSHAPYPNWTAVGVNWLAGFDFEIKVIARVPDATQIK